MAKQSFKDSIYQQIANSQVQQVIKDQRDQDYKLAQDLIAQYQPTNDDMTLAQNLIAQYQQPAPQPEPVVSQPQVPVLKKQTGPTKEEKLKAFSENYARQQQEESMLQSAKGNAEKQAKREAAIRAGRDKFFGKEADAVVKQAKVNKVLSEGKKVDPVVGNRINQVDLSQYNLPSDGFTEEEQKTFANAEKAKQWTQPGYKMSKAEQKEAKRIAAEGKQALAEKYPVTNKADYGKLLDRMSPEDREKYLAFEDLGNKADSLASFSVGAADQAIKMGGGLFDTYALFHPFDPNAARSAKAYKELVQDNWNEKAEGMKELAQNAAPLAENVPVIGEITPYGAGKTAAQMGAYLLSDQAFSELGGMVSGGSKIGQFVGNQVGQNLQDVFLDSIPRYNELKSQGYSEEEIRNILAREGLLNFAGNGFMGVLGEVPGLVKGVGENIAAKNAADAAFRENVRAGADRLSQLANGQIPGIEDVDNVVRNATKQIPNLPDYVTGGPSGTYDITPASIKAANETNPDDVIYHSGILSKLNKAETRGKMSEGSRNTGYYGTGHYFVDSKHKAELDNNHTYRKQPYSSVDISKYNNLYKATTDQKASDLHDFSQKYTRYVNGYNDRYFVGDDGIDMAAKKEYLDDLYAQFRRLFPEQNVSEEDFISKLDAFKESEKDIDLMNRDDSVFTQFMKDMGYNGVDTRGTRSADTSRGIVIYDLDEDSILQSNVKADDVKQGLMNTRVRNENEPIFDAAEDARIQKLLDQQKNKAAILSEYHRLYDDTALQEAQVKYEEIDEQLKNLEENARPYYSRLVSDEKFLDKIVNDFLKEFEEFGLTEDFNVEKANKLADAKERLIEVDEKIADLKQQLAEAKAILDEQDNLSMSAYKQAQEAVNNKTKPISEAQNIENLNKQIPNLPDYVTGGPTGGYDVARNIEPEPVKEAVEEVAKRGPELSAETQEQIASDFEEIYNGMEDMRSIVESSGDAKIAEKYSKMQDAVWNYENLVYNSDSLEEINKAKKAADAARQGFIRAAKKIDPNFKGSLTGTKLGNAEFRRTSTAPTDSALLDEIVDDMVKQDMENPNRFVKDAEPDRQIDSKALRKETNNMKTSFREKAKYLRDSDNPYAKKFLNSIDEFTNNPSVDTYRKMVSAHDDYMGNYNKDVWKSSNSGYYHPEYHSEQITKRLDDIAEKYGFKNSADDKVMAENALGNYKLQTFAGGDGPKENWKTSKFYTNTATKKGWSDNLDAKDYGFRATNAQEQESVFNNRYKDSKDIVRDLVELDSFDDADMRGAMNTMEKLMDGSIDDIRKASRLGKKISFEGREGGRVVQAIGEAKANTPAGQLREAQRTIGDAIDKRVGEGTSEALDNLYEKVMQSYEDSATKEEFSKKLEDLLTGDLKQHVSSKTAKKMQSKQIKGLKKIIKMIDNAESLDNVKIDDLMDVMYKLNGGVLLSPQTQKEVFDLLKEASKLDPSSYEFRRLQAQAARKVMAEVPSGLGDYVRAFLYDNMLGNFKTAFSRNFIGNMAYQSLEKVRELPSAAVDKLVSLGTGKHSSLGWNKGKRKAYTEGFKTGGLETLKDIKSGVNTTRSGQTGWKETLSNNRTVHNDNSKIGHWANQVDFYVENAMKGGDRPIYEANYAEFKTELEQLLDRYGKDGVAGLEKVKDEDVSDVIDKIAAVRAADAVFQKKGHMSEGLTKLRDGLGELSRGALGVDVLSTASTPFTLTPGNMLEKAVEYTPLGVVKNAVETAKELYTGGFNQRRFVEEAGRTITGLPVLGLAYAGAKNGIINGGLSEDQDEKQAQLDDGFIEYGLNVPKQVPLIGGKTLDTSDLPVYGPFAQAGAAMTEEGLTPNSMLQAGEAVLGGSATQGIRRAFGAENGMYNGQGGLLDNLKNTVMASGTQLVPSLVRQTAQTTDKYKRDLGEYGTNEYYLNSIKNSIPGLRQTLPIKTDVEGQPILQNQGRNLGSKVLENYILPMNMSEYKPSALNEEASRLLEATDKAWAFQPKALRKDLRQWDEKAGMKFTEKQFRMYKENLGKKNAQMGNALLESDYYKKLDDEAKVEAMQSVYSAMKALAKENATGIKSDDKIVAAYKKGKEKGVVNYLYGNSLIEEAGISKQSNAAKEAMKLAEQGKFSKAKKVIDDYAKYKEISDQYDVSDGTFIPSDTAQAIKDKIAAGDTTGARQLAKQQSELQLYGFGSDSGMAKYQKAKDAIPGLTTKQFATTYKGMDANGKSGISQTEFLDYVNSLDLTPEQAQQYLEAYGGWENKEGQQKKLVGSSGHYDLTY